MRISHQAIFGTLLTHIQLNSENLYTAQERVATGKRLNRPSDDPASADQALSHRSDLAQLDQYQRNTNQSVSWLQRSETILGQVGDVLGRVRELMMIVGNADKGPSERQMAALEIQQLRDQLLTLANSKHMGSSMFAGHQTTADAFSGAYAYQGDSNAIVHEVAPGRTTTASFTGEEVFNVGGVTVATDPDTFQVFTNIITELQNNDVSNLGTRLDELDRSLDSMIAFRGKAGAMLNYLEGIQVQQQDLELDLLNLRSQAEDADLAEATVELNKRELVYQASLAAGARLVQPTLLDFLR